MSPLNFTHILTQAVDELSESESYKGLFHQHTDGNPLPSAKVLRDIIELARAIIFPGYFGNSTVNSRTVTYHIGVNVERLFDLLTEQIPCRPLLCRRRRMQLLYRAPTGRSRLIGCQVHQQPAGNETYTRNGCGSRLQR